MQYLVVTADQGCSTEVVNVYFVTTMVFVSLQGGIMFWPGNLYLHPQRDVNGFRMTRSNVNGCHNSKKTNLIWDTILS